MNIPSKKPLRLNSASSESLDHYKIKGEKNETKREADAPRSRRRKETK